MPSASATPVPPVSWRRLLTPIAGALVFLAICVSVFVSAYQSPRPHDLAVAVVAPRPVVDRVSAAFDRAAPGVLDVRAYGSEAAAREALLDTRVHAVAVVDGQRERLELASAWGSVPTQAIRSAFTAAAAARGSQLQVQDLRPLPSSDARGIVPTFTVFGCIVPSIVLAALLHIGAGAAPARRRWAVIGAWALSAGFVAGVVAVWASGALDGAFWTTWGACSLVALAVAGVTHGLTRLLSHAAVPVAAVLFVVLGQTSAGGALGSSFLPGFFRGAAEILPNSAGLTTLRNGVYFDGHHVLAAILTLVGWLALGVAFELIGQLRRRASGRTPPATGAPAVATTTA